MEFRTVSKEGYALERGENREVERPLSQRMERAWGNGNHHRTRNRKGSEGQCKTGGGTSWWYPNNLRKADMRRTVPGWLCAKRKSQANENPGSGKDEKSPSSYTGAGEGPEEKADLDT